MRRQLAPDEGHPTPEEWQRILKRMRAERRPRTTAGELVARGLVVAMVVGGAVAIVAAVGGLR